ncbi:MAG TPA: class I SAM-dependent methyltransferase [Solirubrobacterales bacterium]|nr:class I SAM-dependent methyltransferase [Solirubrobacterales bacterium]
MRDSAYDEHYAVEDHHWWFRGRWAVIEALLSRTSLPANPRILDAGCGTGGNLERYSRLGEASGVDPSPDAVRYCGERGLNSVEQAGLESLPFADATFDLIAATDVVEHIEAEERALRELWRVAAPGGAMLLTVPAYMWLWSKEDENLHHKRRYTRPRLRQATERCGWDPQIATYFNSFLLPPIAVAKRLRGQRERGEADLERTPTSLNGLLSLPMRLEAQLIRRGVSLPAGVSVGIVCRKVD